MQPAFMYPAAAAGEVDVIGAYSSDGRIAKHDLVVLDDPKRAIPPYDAMMLVAPKRAGDRALLGALRPLIGAIEVTRCARPTCAPRGEPSPDEAARWLWQADQARSAANLLQCRRRRRSSSPPSRCRTAAHEDTLPVLDP